MSEQYSVKDQPLDLVKDTFAEPVLLLDLGFTTEFIRSHEERVVKILVRTGMPVWGEVNGRVLDIHIDSPIIGLTVIKSECGDHFVLSMLRTVKQTYCIFKKGHFDFMWRIKGGQRDAQDAVRALLEANLDRGARLFNNAVRNLPDYWYKLLGAVYFDKTILPITLTTAKGKVVPCRVYFDPEDRNANIISFGGFCYHFDLNEYPYEEMKAGIGKYCQELGVVIDKAVKKGKLGNGLTFKAPQGKDAKIATKDKLQALMAHYSKTPA